MTRSTATRRTAQQQAIDVEIGHRIRSRRLIAGMSQTELSEQLGVTFQQVQKYEKGTNRVIGSRLLQITAALGTTLVELLSGLEQPVKERAPLFLAEFCADPQGVAIARAFMSIASKRQRLAVAGLVQSMAQDDARRGPARLRRAG